jgi:hypothetical protein
MNLRKVTNPDLTWLKDGNSDIVDFLNISSRRKNYVTHILNIHTSRVSDSRQIKILSCVLVTIDGV